MTDANAHPTSDRREPEGEVSEAPIFVVGASRSGTTMLRLLMNAHSRIGIPGELGFFHTFAQSMDVANWRTLDGVSAHGFGKLVGGYLRPKHEQLRGVDVEALVARIAAGPHDLRSAYRAIVETWAETRDKPRWGEKTPLNIFFVDVILDMFPDGRFVQIVRDPRGAVSSMNRFSRFSDDTVVNAFNWQRAVVRGGALLEYVVPESQRLTIRFEDLVADPEPVLRRVCAFVGEEFESSMLDFHRDAKNNMHPNFPNLGGGSTVTKPVAGKTASKWKEKLTRKEVAAIEQVCGVGMQAFGYEPEATRLSVMDRLRIRTTVAYCNWKCWRNRERRQNQVKYRPLARLHRNAEASGKT